MAEDPTARIAADRDRAPLTEFGVSVFDSHVEHDAELRARQHVVGFALDLLDPAATTDQRATALRHLLACDPLRAVGLLSDLARNAFAHIEETYGNQSGEIVAQFRTGLAEAEAEMRAATAAEAHRG